MKSQRIRTLSKLAASAALAITLASASNASPADTTTVVVKDFMFAPMASTIKAGTTVTWLNKDDEPHTVVSDTGLFHSAALDTNETFSFEFDKPGTYRFICSIHPSMVGTIVVQ
jgi:plastocyanin